MADEFKVVRYGLEMPGRQSKPLYATMKEARAAALADNKNFSPPIKTKAVEVDITDKVMGRIYEIVLKAHSNTSTPQETEELIKDLIRYTQRGY